MNEIKFKHDTFIGQTVYEIEINVRSDGDMNKDTSLYKHGIHVKELKIVYQTNYKIALSTEWISILDRQKEGKRKESYKHFLEEIVINVRTKETYFANGIFCHMYSLIDPKKGIKKIKREAINKIQSEYGFLNIAISQIENFELK